MEPVHHRVDPFLTRQAAILLQGIEVLFSRQRALRLGAPVVGITLLVVAFWFWGGFSSSSPVPLGQFYSVAPMDLDVKISKDGELAALNNIDIICEVEGQTAIQTIVAEGATVKKGDVLVVLDSSAIKQKIEDTTLDLQTGRRDPVVEPGDLAVEPWQLALADHIHQAGPRLPVE